MPFAVNDVVRIYWRLEGDPHRPPLVLLHSIGSDSSMWDRAAPHLTRAFSLLRIDLRGHGASDAPGGEYTMAAMAADVAAAMDAAEIARAAIAGVSLGGMVAIELALAAPDRVVALALVCTSAALDPAMWEDRIARVRAAGVAAIAEVAMSRFLSPAFAAADPAAAASVRAALLATSDNGYAGSGAAIRDMNLIDGIGAIAMPTLIVAGTRDISTPFAGHGDRILERVSTASVVQVDAAHLAPVEAPADVAAAICRFMRPPPATAEAADMLYEAGLANRRRVLGDAWVDAALAARTDFNSDFQAMITRIAWQEVWGRPGLDERTRRLLVVAVTASLGRWEEYRLHVRTGLERGGFSRDELKEVLMQLAIYAGVPAANTAFAEAVEVMHED